MDKCSLDINAGIHLEEQLFLTGLIKRANQLIYSDMGVVRIDDLRLPKNPKDLYIASCAFKLPYPKSEHLFKPHQRRRDCRVFKDDHTAVRYKENMQYSKKDVINAFNQINNLASKIDIHFALFNELAISFHHDPEKNPKQYLLGDIAKRMFKNESKFFLIPGTFHCKRTYLNVAPIVSPFFDPHPTEITWGFSNHIAKQNRAVKQGEKIRTEDDRDLTYFSTPYGNFLVWICLDMYDPSLVLKLFQHNQRLSQERPADRDLIDLVFIPSFNRDNLDNVKLAAQYISKFCRTTVVISNHYTEKSGKNTMTDSFCFYFGKEIKPINKHLNIHTNYKKFKLKIFKIDNWHDRKFYQSPRENSGIPSSIFGQAFGGYMSSFIPIKD